MQKCLVIGNPVKHSLSPLIHNHGYRLLGISNKFKYDYLEVDSGELREFVNSVRNSDISGVSCTMPHKIDILPLLDQLSPEASSAPATHHTQP